MENVPLDSLQRSSIDMESKKTPSEELRNEDLITTNVSLIRIGNGIVAIGGQNEVEIQTQQFRFGTGTIQAFANDAAAGVGGLVGGDVYQTDGTGAAPLNAAGILMIKQ